MCTVFRIGKISATVPISTIFPAYITATRPPLLPHPRSWLTKTVAVPFLLYLRNSVRICSVSFTSSAVVAHRRRESGDFGKRNRHHTALTHTPESGKDIAACAPPAGLCCQFHQFPHSVMHNLPGDSRLVQPYSFPIWAPTTCRI